MARKETDETGIGVCAIQNGWHRFSRSESDGRLSQPHPIACPTDEAMPPTQYPNSQGTMKKHRKHKGLLSIEMVVAIGVLATIIAVLAALSDSFGKLNAALWAQHTCYAAGQAQMDAIAITGEPINPAKFKSLWPTVTCQIKTTEGTDQWQGLTQVQLSLSARAKKKTIQVQMTRYLPSDKGSGQ